MMPAPESEPQPTSEPQRVEEDDEADAASLFRLYFVRHAPAGSREDFSGPDEQRPLTKRGRKRLRDARDGLRALIGVPDAIISSPYARAQETAELLVKGLRFAGSVELNDHLVHGGDAQMLESILASHAGQRDLVLVGHSPDLERWIAHLTAGPGQPPFLELKKGGVARVDVLATAPEQRAVLRWVVPPSVLRSIS